MLVCLCNGLNEARVREAADACGSAKVRDVYQSLGCAIDCGTCVGFAKTVIDETRAGVRQALLPAE